MTKRKPGRPRLFEEPRMLSVRASKLMEDNLRDAAARRGTSMSALMRQALRRVIAESLETDPGSAPDRMEIETK